MAGAVAFVFGLCALSFAAGCVVTVLILRRRDPVSTPVQPPALPVEAPGEPKRVEQWGLLWPNEDISAKPIHRNPPLEPAHPEAVADPESEPVVDPDPEPVAEVPVVFAPPAAPTETSEFRRRYLRTFEVARRRSSFEETRHRPSP